MIMRIQYLNGALYHIQTNRNTTWSRKTGRIQVQIWTYAPRTERDNSNGYQFPSCYQYAYTN
jgi:hypothetical protein